MDSYNRQRSLAASLRSAAESVQAAAGYRRLGPVALALLVVATLACRPVVTVSWTEVAVVAVILIVVLLPLLLRILRFLARVDSSRQGVERQDQEDSD